MKHDEQEFLSAMMDGEWQTLDVRRAIAEVRDDEVLRAKWSRYHLARHAMRRDPGVPVGSLAERITAALADEPAHSNVTAIGGGAVPAADVVAGPADAAGTDGSAAERGAADAATVRSVPRGGAARTFAAGFGLAASVAAVTALGLNALSGGGAEGGPDAAGARVAGVAPTEVTVASAQGGAVPAPPTSGVLPRRAPGATLPAVELVSNTAPGAYWVAPDSSARRADSEARLNMLLSQHIENSPTAERQGMLPYSRLVGYAEGGPTAGRTAEDGRGGERAPLGR